MKLSCTRFCCTVDKGRSRRRCVTYSRSRKTLDMRLRHVHLLGPHHTAHTTVYAHTSEVEQSVLSRVGNSISSDLSRYIGPIKRQLVPLPVSILRPLREWRDKVLCYFHNNDTHLQQSCANLLTKPNIFSYKIVLLYFLAIDIM